MKIHGHPQKTDYKDDGSDWPVISKQGHWPGSDPTMTTHIHIDVKFPYGAEIGTTPFVCPFTLKAFMLDGSINLFDGDSFAGIHWDLTNSPIMPIMKGDPHSMVPKTWTGKVTIDPQKGRFAHKHGWVGVPFLARTVFTNGDVFDVKVFNGFFSIADISQPEVPQPGNFTAPALSTRVDASHKNQEGKFGTMICEINDWIPLLPIDKPWTSIINFYNYTAPVSSGSMPNGRFEQRLDVDFHNGVMGTLLEGINCDKNGVHDENLLGHQFVLNPAILGIGKHKICELWKQTFEEDSVASLIVFDTEVASGGGTTVKVPDLKGMTEDSANTALTAAGLMLGTVTETNDQTVLKGNVISQLPVKDTSVLTGSTVNVVVSLGPVVAPNEVWVPAVPTFMQLHVNGVPTNRWQICGVDDNTTMDNCVELVTKPDDGMKM